MSYPRFFQIAFAVALFVAIAYLALTYPRNRTGSPAGGLSRQVATQFLPNPTLTPGEVLTTDMAKLCTPNYTKTVRNVPNSLKEQVRREYGLKNKRDLWCNSEQGCEIDHLISLEVGGSNDIKNLWPQSYEGEWNAHQKDVLENKLHALVCAGQIKIDVAQHDIATNWIDAYKKYVHD